MRQHLLTCDDALRLRDVAADRALEFHHVALRLQDLHRLGVRDPGDIECVAAGVAREQETHGRKRGRSSGDGDKLFHVTSVAGCGQKIAQKRESRHR